MTVHAAIANLARFAKRSTMHWTAEELDTLAYCWLAEIKAETATSADSASEAVVLMNFTAPADLQWIFLKQAVFIASSDLELQHIAAGPFEHLLSCHGDDYIAAVEEECQANAKFARMTTGAWQCGMSDQIWARVNAIQARIDDPI